MPKYLIFIGLFLGLSCAEPSIDSNPTNPPISKKVNVESLAIDTTTYHIYPWLAQYDYKNNLVHQIPVPTGFKRTQVAKKSLSLKNNSPGSMVEFSQNDILGIWRLILSRYDLK